MQKKPQPPRTGWENHDNGDAGQPRWSSYHEQMRLRMLHKHCRSKASGLPCEAGVTVPATKLRQWKLREVRPTGLRTKGQLRINPRHYVLTAGRQGPQARSPLRSFTPDIDAGRQKSMECYSHFLDEKVEALRGHAAFPESPREGHGQPQVSLV